MGSMINMSSYERVMTFIQQREVHQASEKHLEANNKSRFQPYNSFTKNVKNNHIALQNEYKKSKKALDIESAINKINAGYKVLIVLRGLPGSGKTTLAKSILNETISYNVNTKESHIFSTDDFFKQDGIYQYNETKLSAAHDWNKQRTFNAMRKGYSPVIIDDTNSQIWEMKPYVMMATGFGYILEILEPDTFWCFNVKELTKRNKHNMSKSTIKNLMDRYEKNVTPMKVINLYDCKYQMHELPQLRNYPPINTQSIKSNIPKSESCILTSTIDNLMFFDTFVNAVSKETLNLIDSNISNVSFKTLPQRKKSENSISDVNNLMQQTGSILKSSIVKSIPTPKTEKSLFDNMQNAWGVDETTFRSWDIVIPINETASEDIEICENNTEPVVETREMSTNTDIEDFSIMTNILRNLPSKNIKILNAYNRDINNSVPLRQHGVKRKLMLDKSCFTDNCFEDQDIEMKHLTLLAKRDKGVTMGDKHKASETLLETNSLQEHIMKNGDSEFSSIPESRVYIRNKLQNNSHLSKELQQLKKIIESKITISDKHYSKKLLRIKHREFRQSHLGTSPQRCSSNAFKLEEPTKCISFNSNFNKCLSEYDDWKETYPDVNQNARVKFILEEHFLKELKNNLGNTSLIYSKVFNSIIQVPVKLAQQICPYNRILTYQPMDAQNTAIKVLVKEKKEVDINHQENKKIAPTSIIQENEIKTENPKIPDIMREQKKLSKWQKEHDKWKELTPDTLAAKLTKQKLFNQFPSLDKETLIEILHAHDNVYKDTVETLLASTYGAADVTNHIDTIENLPEHKTVNSETWPAHKRCKVTKKENVPRSPREYREEANQFFRKRLDLYEKAQRYYQSGMPQVAQFYSGLASQQTVLYEKANSLAATAFVDEHFKRVQDFTILDLHSFNVKEAIPSLDAFLDRNINLLRSSSKTNKKCLQIITGRGKNSPKGISKIKPAVINRLKQRNICFHILNPGLLKVKITKHSAVTNEFGISRIQ